MPSTSVRLRTFATAYFPRINDDAIRASSLRARRLLACPEITAQVAAELQRHFAARLDWLGASLSVGNSCG
jgi:hypothetical protein